MYQKKKKRCHRYVSFLRRTHLTFNYSSTNIVKTLIWMSGQLVSRSHFKQQRVNLPPAACEHLQVYHVLLVSKLPTSRLIPPCLLGRTCSTQLQQKSMAYKAGIFLQLGHFSWFGYVKGSYCMYVVKYSSQCCHNAAWQPGESLTDLHQLPNTQIYSVMAGGSVTHSLFAFTYLAAAHFQSVLTWFLLKCIAVRGFCKVVSFPRGISDSVWDGTRPHVIVLICLWVVSQLGLLTLRLFVTGPS